MKKTNKAEMTIKKTQNGMKRRKQMIRIVVTMQHEPAQSYPVTVLKLSKNSCVLRLKSAGGAACCCWGGICTAGCGGGTGRGCCMLYGCCYKGIG